MTVPIGNDLKLPNERIGSGSREFCQAIGDCAACALVVTRTNLSTWAG